MAPVAIVSQQSDGGTDGSDDDSVSVVESELLIYLTAKAGALLLDATGEIRGIGEWPFLCSRCEWKEGRIRNKGALILSFL